MSRGEMSMTFKKVKLLDIQPKDSARYKLFKSHIGQKTSCSVKVGERGYFGGMVTSPINNISQEGNVLKVEAAEVVYTLEILDEYKQNN